MLIILIFVLIISIILTVVLSFFFLIPFFYGAPYDISRKKSLLNMVKLADPKKEAALVKEVVVKQQKKDPINALILGGVGLQETQLKSIQDALRPLGIEVFASHAGEEHDLIMEDMLNKGFEIFITQVASDGLMPWLGKKITKENFEQLKADSVKYKFHIGAEGGYYDTLVTDAAFFSKRLIIKDMEIIKEDAYCGHVEIKDVEIIDKKVQEIKN